MNGLITQIQRGSIHDGPGLRTVVFLKGCNMRCSWCHNPESILPYPQLSFEESKCIGCGRCLAVCRVARDPARCTGCFACAAACPSGALSVTGVEMSAEEVMAQVMEDEPFYRPEGGMTLSGGEPMCQPEFSQGLLRRCREKRIHTVLETNLSYDETALRAVLPYVDLWSVDVKHVQSDKHCRATGAALDPILQNLAVLSEENQPMIVKTPVIPGFNDTSEEIADIARFVGTLHGVVRYELLRYNPFGCTKARRHGMSAYAEPLQNIPKETMDTLLRVAAAVTPTYYRGKQVDL